MVEEITFPDKGKAGMEQGVAFFILIRSLKATVFIPLEMGGNDIGYAGNKPNQGNGVPEEVLAQFKLANTDKELKESNSFNGSD